MAVTIYLNREDLGAVAAQIRRTALPEDLARDSQTLWDSGWSRWATARRAPLEERWGDPEMCRLTLDDPVNRRRLVEFLNRFAAYYGTNDGEASYLAALGKHIRLAGL